MILDLTCCCLDYRWLCDASVTKREAAAAAVHFVELGLHVLPLLDWVLPTLAFLMILTYFLKLDMYSRAFLCVKKIWTLIWLGRKVIYPHQALFYLLFHFFFLDFGIWSLTEVMNFSGFWALSFFIFGKLLCTECLLCYFPDCHHLVVYIS